MNQGTLYRSVSNCTALVINSAALMIAVWEWHSDDDCHFGQDLSGIILRGGGWRCIPHHCYLTQSFPGGNANSAVSVKVPGLGMI